MRILVVGKIWPEPSSSAAGKRTLDIIESLLATGWETHFACAAQKSEYSFNLENTYSIPTHSITLNDSSFDQWVKELAPHIVIFDRYMTEEQFGWRVEQNLPDSIRVVDTSDLHCLREARHQKLKTGQPLNLYNAIAHREIASILRSDLSLVISEFELDLLQSSFPIPDAICAYWPFMIGKPIESTPNFETRSDFVMIGSFLHEPNWDAVQYCQREIWPEIRASIPRAKIHVYGSYAPLKALKLNSPKNGFLVKGRADDAIQTLAAHRVNLAPLRFGAGLKGKLFDAMQTGTPTVASTIAIEGICGNYDWGSFIEDNPKLFAKAAIELYQSKEKWTKAQESGYTIAKERFARELWIAKLPQLLQNVYNNRENNRATNFIGQMLRHHAHRSTEYMSRWIEAKNRT